MGVSIEVRLGFDRPVSTTSERYALLGRVRAACARYGVQWLAFNLNDQRIRLVLEGPSTDIRRALTGLRRGIAHSSARRGAPLRLAQGRLESVADLHGRVVALHRDPAGADPLGEIWSSHRDLMGLREAPFFDVRPLVAQVDARKVHHDAGGGPLPAGWPPNDADRVSLDLLLRVASAVMGVLPADRRSFPIFVHLSRRAGYRVATIADALTLTPRRVRQILGQDPELLPAAVASIEDTRLRVVP